jgi:hypothetical protein
MIVTMYKKSHLRTLNLTKFTSYSFHFTKKNNLQWHYAGEIIIVDEMIEIGEIDRRLKFEWR